MVAAVGFDIENADDIWIPDWGVEIELDLDVCQELGIVWLPNLNAVGGGLLFDQKVANHGTLTNSPTWTKGKFGEPAISFDGSNDRIALASSFTGTVYSASLWVNTSDTDAVLIGGSGSAGLGRVDYCPYIDGTNIYHRSAFAASGGAAFVAHGGFSGWTHFAVTRNGTAISFYKNGVQLSTTQTQDNNNSSTFTTIGDFGDGTVPFAGSMSNLLFSGSCLTAAQVYELYRNPFLPYWQPSRTSFFDMRYDPTPYERSFRSLTPNAFAFDSGEANAKAINASYGQVTLNDTAISLDYTSEGRLIPSSPVGFQVQFRAKAANADYSFIQFARVYKNGSEVWSQGYTYGTANIGATDTDFTIGDATELFDTTWTATDEFKVRIEIYAGYIGADTLYVDGCELTTWYSDGSSQTITITVASATASASAPTVTPGAATVTMPTASSTAAASSPTVTPGATTVTPPTCSATAAASAPTLTPTVTIVLPTASATASATTPTITAGTSTITVTTASATGTASAPTITPTVDIASPTASATAAATAPSVTAGATTITVTTGTATAAAIDAGITNATLITPGDATATAAVSALLVIFGSTSIVVGTATGTAAVSSPTIAAGTTTISVGVVSATAGAVVVAVVSGNTAGTSTASVFYVLHGTDTHPIPLLGADPRPHEAAGTSNRFRELKG